MRVREHYRFGAFELDVTERRLRHGGQPIALAPKSFDLLVALVRHAGHLVTKRELLDCVWPECFVEEGILAVHVSGLRKALGDTNRPSRFIETVARSGYRFLACVPEADAGAASRVRPEVLELIGRGRVHLLGSRMGEVPEALAAFRAAIALDPTCAAAHAGLALAHCAAASLRVAPAAEAYRDARTAALRALAMDASCADAQVALAEVLFLSEWNWVGAERSLRRALELDPHHTKGCLLYGQLLEALGRLDDGLAVKLRALERDPLSPLVHVQISLSYWNQRRFDDSIAWARKTLALDPRHLLAREHLAGAYWAKGDFDRHMAENITHAESYGLPATALDPLREAYAAGGRSGVVRYALRCANQQPHAASDVQLALLYSEAGEMDAAFRHLELAIDNRDPCVVHLAVAPQWDHLRTDPRFAHCVSRMGLTPLQPA